MGAGGGVNGNSELSAAARTVLFGQLDVELGDYFAGVARHDTEERARAIHDEEAEAAVVGEQRRERLRVELVVAQIQRRVDRPEWLEVDVHLALLPVLRENRPAVDEQSVRRHYEQRAELW